MRRALLVAVVISMSFANGFAGDGANWKGPCISVKLNQCFGKYMDSRDELMDNLADVRSSRDNNGDNARGIRDSIRSLRNEVAKKVTRETRKIKRARAKLEKLQDTYDKQLEKAGDNAKKKSAIEANVKAVNQKIGELVGLNGAYNMFEAYCTEKQSGLAGTALGLKGKQAPQLTGKTTTNADFDLSNVKAPYRIILFFSVFNRNSVVAVRDVLRMNGKKISGKLVKTVFVNVDRDESVKKKRDDYLNATFKNVPVLIDDTNDLCAAYKVIFLPQAILVNGNGSVLKVVVGDKVYTRIRNAIKRNAKRRR